MVSVRYLNQQETTPYNLKVNSRAKSLYAMHIVQRLDIILGQHHSCGTMDQFEQDCDLGCYQTEQEDTSIHEAEFFHTVRIYIYIYIIYMILV